MKQWEYMNAVLANIERAMHDGQAQARRNRERQREIDTLVEMLETLDQAQLQAVRRTIEEVTQ